MHSSLFSEHSASRERGSKGREEVGVRECPSAVRQVDRERERKKERKKERQRERETKSLHDAQEEHWLPALPIAGIADEEDDVVPEEDLRTCRRIQSGFAALSIDPRPQVSYTSRPTLVRHLAAIAEGSTRAQKGNLEDVLRYIHSLHIAKAVRPLCFFQQMAFDETPLKLKVSFGGGHTLETGRVVAVQSEWAILIKDLTVSENEDPSASYWLLRGHVSPQLKACDRETGECYACVLQATIPRPDPGLLQIFDSTVLLAESDEAGANSRALRLFSPQYEDPVCLHLFCLLHKVHSVASKTFSLIRPELRGVARTLLVLHQPGVMAKMKTALKEEIAKQFDYQEVDALCPLSDDAQAYRSNILKFFTPKRGRRPAVIVDILSQTIFNGDWRRVGKVTHRCNRATNCCRTREEALEKAQRWGCRLISALGVRLLNRGNWLAWHECLDLLAVLLGMHGLMPIVFSKAISKSAARGAARGPDMPDMELDVRLEEVADEVGDAGGPLDMDDRVQIMRYEQAQHRKDAMNWLFSANGHQDPFQTVFTLKVALAGEIKMMATLVEACSARKKIIQLQSQLDGMVADGSNSFTMVSVVQGEECSAMLETALTNLTTEALWVHFPHTELEVGRIWRLMLRPSSVAFQLVWQQLQRYPSRLFRLLGPDGAAERAHLLEARECVLDDFSLHYRKKYATDEALQSPEARQTLAAAATMCTGNTFSTEVLHSKNARRCRSRHHTHAMTLPTLAYQHLNCSAPDWLQKLAEPENGQEEVDACVWQLD